MMRVLIDTDVVLDFFLAREPFSAAANKIFDLIEEEKLIGAVTPVIICNTYYILRKAGSHQEVVDELSAFLEWVEVLIIDKVTLINAMNSKFKDFEDAVQSFSALKAKNIDYIVSRNVKDFKHSIVPVLSSEEFIEDHFSS